MKLKKSTPDERLTYSYKLCVGTWNRTKFNDLTQHKRGFLLPSQRIQKKLHLHVHLFNYTPAEGGVMIGT